MTPSAEQLNKQEQEELRVLKQQQDKESFERFKTLVKEYNKLGKEGYTDIFEKFQLLQSMDLIPEPVEIEVTKYVEQPYKMSDEEREYHRQYRELKKQQLAEKNEQDRIQAKIDFVLSKKNKIHCLGCNNVVPVIKPEPIIRLKANEKRRKLLLKSYCPKCKKEIISWGGFID